MDAKTKKKKIYVPLKKIIKDIMKDLKELELNIPIAKIARMDLAGLFNDDQLVDFRKTIHDYLKVTNKYRQLYFDLMNNSKIEFDKQMTQDGSFAPGLKQYDSVRTQVNEALLKGQTKAWILSYDQYLPTIREHANKRVKSPRSGQKMLDDLFAYFKKDLKNIKEMQKLSIQISKLFLKDINYAIKNPELQWQEWLVVDNASKSKSKTNVHQLKKEH